jgi:FkbM family methyltransferase
MTFLTSWRIKDRQHFFAPLLQGNAFCFDIGANHGEYSATFLSLDARRVVAVEPQPDIARFIVDRFPTELANGTLVVCAVAVGAQEGSAMIYPASDIGMTMSTLSRLFVEVSKRNGSKWDESAAFNVPVVTLDSLIRKFGMPDYIKIDVEGYDLEVLRGLSHAVAMLSVEFNTQAGLIEIAEECVKRIDSMGPYQFNYHVEAPGQAALQFGQWVSGAVMRYTLRHDLSRTAVFGDIFARLRT